MRRLALGLALLGLGLASPSPVAADAAADHAVAEAKALAERAEAGSSEAIAALLPLLQHPDSKVRYQAEWGLARAGAASVPALIGELRRVEGDEARASVARLLGRVGLAARDAVPELRAALADPDSSAASAASYALGHLRAWEAVPDLVRAYAASRSIPNQTQMGRALRRIGSDQGLRTAQADLVASVRQGLSSDDPRARAAHVTHAWALYRKAESDGDALFPSRSQLRALVPGLAAALRDPDARVAEQALHALALAGRDAGPALPELERLVADPALGHAALEALRALGSPVARRVVDERLALEALEKRIRSAFSVRDHLGRTELLPFRVAGSAEDGLRMSTRFLYPGREPRAPDRVVVHLESTSPAPRFADVREIVWRADGVAVPMRDLDRTWSRSQLGGVIEEVSGTLPVADFFTLANARELRTDAGGVAFSLRREDLAALRHFAGKIPRSSGRASAP